MYGGARVVVIAFVSSNIYKSLNAFRPFYSYDHDLKLTKPRFKLSDGGLEFVPNPVPVVAGYEALLRDPGTELLRLGALDAYYRQGYRRHALDRLAMVRLARVITHEVRKFRQVRDKYGRFVPGSEALQTTLATLDAFCARVRADASIPVVVLLPTPEDARRHRRHGVRPWGPLAQHLAAARIPHLDGLAALCDAEPAPLPSWFDGRHLTPAANDRLAQRLAEIVRPLVNVAPPVMPSTTARDPVQPVASRVPGGSLRAPRAETCTGGPPTA